MKFKVFAKGLFVALEARNLELRANELMLFYFISFHLNLTLNTTNQRIQTNTIVLKRLFITFKRLTTRKRTITFLLNAVLGMVRNRFLVLHYLSAATQNTLIHEHLLQISIKLLHFKLIDITVWAGMIRFPPCRDALTTIYLITLNTLLWRKHQMHANLTFKYIP